MEYIMADKLKMGFIGLGFVGPQHADGVALNWDIASAYAVADDDPVKQEMAKKMGLKTYDSAEEMIADPEIDTVHIAGPDRFHAGRRIPYRTSGTDVRRFPGGPFHREEG